MSRSHPFPHEVDIGGFLVTNLPPGQCEEDVVQTRATQAHRMDWNGQLAGELGDELVATFNLNAHGTVDNHWNEAEEFLELLNRSRIVFS